MPTFYHSLLPINDRIQVETAVRETNIKLLGTIAQMFGGIAVLIGGYIAWQNLKAVQRNIEIAESNTQMALQSQITERFSKAVEHFGDLIGENIAVRLGGIYSLERIAIDSERDYWTIIEILTTYVRHNTQWTDENEKRIVPVESSEAAVDFLPAQLIGAMQCKVAYRANSNESEIAPDIEAILKVLGRRNTKRDKLNQKLDLRKCNIATCELRNMNFMNTNFHLSHLDFAEMNDSNLQCTDFTDSWLRCTNFARSDLRGANLSGSKLRGANFLDCNLENAKLSYAALDGANFNRANLRKANLFGASLQYVWFQGADLSGANLRGAKGLNIDCFNPIMDRMSGSMDEMTQLPKGWEFVEIPTSIQELMEGLKYEDILKRDMETSIELAKQRFAEAYPENEIKSAKSMIVIPSDKISAEEKAERNLRWQNKYGNQHSPNTFLVQVIWNEK
jgi:uncharacterized protein YjbI with pentapeptide repeats